MVGIWVKFDLNYEGEVGIDKAVETPGYATNIKGYKIPVYIPYAQPYGGPNTPEEYIVDETYPLVGQDGHYLDISKTALGSYYDRVQNEEQIIYEARYPMYSSHAVDVSVTRPPDKIPKMIKVIRHDDYLDKDIDLSFLDYVWRYVDVKINFPKWEFTITRKQDGQSEITFSENGKIKFQTSEDISTDCAYDDATPIDVGSYKAMYRTNGNVNRDADGNSEYCIELSSYDGKSTVLNRTAIQIHVGNTPQDSEVCIVASNSSFLNNVRKYMNKVLEEMDIDQTHIKSGQSFYNIPKPIIVNIEGQVLQPKINMPSDSHCISKLHDFTIHPKINFTNFGTKPGVSKEMVVTFTNIDSSADLREDYQFNSNVVKIGTNTFQAIIKANRSDFNLKIDILADKKAAKLESTEIIKLKILDVELYNTKGIYHDSIKSPGKLAGYEKLLVGDNTFNFTIDADKSTVKSQKNISHDIVSNDTSYSHAKDSLIFKTDLDGACIQHVTHFKVAADTIELENAIFTKLAVGEMWTGAFKAIAVAGAKVDSTDRILYDHNTGALSYDADGSGLAKAVQFAVIDNHARLTSADFFIV